MTGRWCAASTARPVRSSVKRTDGSNVRMPRSHSTTWSLPPEQQVLARGKGLLHRATEAALGARPGDRSGPPQSAAKFCMFRAPIWNPSTTSASRFTCSGSITSVTKGMAGPPSASTSRSRPSHWRPWKECGEVRGLNTPPRRPHGAVPSDDGRGGHHLFRRLHRARSREHRDGAVADRGRPQGDRRPGRAQFPAPQPASLFLGTWRVGAGRSDPASGWRPHRTLKDETGAEAVHPCRCAADSRCRIHPSTPARATVSSKTSRDLGLPRCVVSRPAHTSASMVARLLPRRSRT